MGAATIGVAQEENEEEGIDEQDIFHRMVFFLAAITRFLFNRVLGADDPSFRPVMGKRGTSGAAPGATTSGAAVSSSGATTEAASASETPSRWARAAQGTGGSITEGAQGREEGREEHVNPLVGLALAHAE